MLGKVMWENRSSIKLVEKPNNQYTEYKVENLTIAQLLDITDEKVTSLLGNDNVLIKLVDQKHMILWHEVDNAGDHGWFVESIIVVANTGSN